MSFNTWPALCIPKNLTTPNVPCGQGSLPHPTQVLISHAPLNSELTTSTQSTFSQAVLPFPKNPKPGFPGPFNMEIGAASARCCIGQQRPRFMWNSQKLHNENSRKILTVASPCTRLGYPRLADSHPGFAPKHWMSNAFWRTNATPASLGESSPVQSENYSSDEENASADSPEDLLAQPLTSDELKSLLADSERKRLTKKLSEANQQNRFLKRQLHVKEDSLVNFKGELAVMELEIQALVTLAEEIAQYSIPEGSRKINGKYIQSHLHSRLEALHARLKEQVKDVDAAQSKEVLLFWCGMAESVQVMGTFDGWSQGEQLSPEYDGSFTKFTATLMLRPGRYEIKFLVDGEWQLSPEYPTVGEGFTENNLLLVE